MSKRLVALASITLGAPAVALPGATPNATDEPTCAVVSSDFAATAQPDVERTLLFAEYGNTQGKWVGGDSTYSAELKNGEIAWVFSDTVLGSVTGTSVLDPGFVNNSIVVERSGRLVDTHYGDRNGEPAALIQSTEENTWYWIGDNYVQPNGDLQITANKYRSTGPTTWDFAWDNTIVATVDTNTWMVTDVNDIISTHGIQWTAAIERFGPRTYIYGVLDQGESKSLHVARIVGHDLGRRSAWEYWDGEDWSRDEADAVPIAENVANEVSVTRYRDGYLLITQDTSTPFSSRIDAYFSCSPTGGFTNRTHLYDMPEVGPSGTYGDPNVYAYNAHAHPHLSNGTNITLSYNVNTFDTEHIFEDVTIYRPRFVSVSLEPIH